MSGSVCWMRSPAMNSWLGHVLVEVSLRRVVLWTVLLRVLVAVALMLLL